MDAFTISKIKNEEERGQLVALLNEANLPVSDLPQNLDHFYLAKIDEKVIGSIGLEVYESSALLRSMVVTQGMQGEGLGKILLNKLISKVSEGEMGIKEIFLITEKAEKFFRSSGFETINRDEVPEILKQIPQFNDVCPASAAVMKKVVF